MTGSQQSATSTSTSIFRGGFAALFWTQFLGAFNDNLFKNALVITLTFGLAQDSALSSEQLVAIAGGAFIFPFFILSAVAGQIADKFPKGRVVRWVKVSEVAIMVLGAGGFIVHSTGLLFTALCLMGMQSAMFGPVKYGMLPELLPQDKLVAGNAAVEMGTFLSILLGTIAGGVLIAMEQWGPLWVGLTAITVAVLGLFSALRVPHGSAADSQLTIDRNPIPSTLGLWKIVRREPKSVANSILGISWFWLLGAVVLSILPAMVRKHLGGNEAVVTYLLGLFSVGVALGSLLCERLSFQQLELGLVPIGSAGITLFLLATALLLGPGDLRPASTSLLSLLQSTQGLSLSVCLALFSVASGLFIVPLYTLLQERSDEAQRSRVIAANNMVNALFMVLGSALLTGLFTLGVSIPQVLGILALLNLAVAIYIYTLIPEFLFRFICFVLGHVLYRIRVTGKQHIPMTGAAVLVCNHVTFIDWLIISVASQRPMRFVMHYGFFKLPLLGWFFRDAKVIPIAGMKEDPDVLASAFDRIAAELQAGELVCIFPEGKLTGDGHMNPFRQGIERILAETPVPVVPMHLHGLWGSVFSRHRDRKPFRRFWSRIHLSIGELLPPEQASATTLEARVRALGPQPTMELEQPLQRKA